MKKLLAATIILVAATLIACRRQESAPLAGGGSQSGGGPVTINIWTLVPDLVDASIPAFERDYPNIKIERLSFNSVDVPIKVQQSLAAGLEMPDIVPLEISQRAELLEMDIWENLEQAPYNLRKDMFIDYSIPLVQNSRGEIIGIDESLMPTGMAYKKELTRQYLGTDDRAALESMFRSLDDFVTRGAEVSRASGGRVFMFSNPQSILLWTANANPTKLVDNDGSINFTGKIRDGIDFLIKLRDVNAVDALELWSPQDDASYAANNHIFYNMPPWGIQDLIKANNPNGQGRWGLMIPPTGPHSWGGTVWSIYKGSKHKAEAWEYLKRLFLTREGAELCKRTYNFITSVKEFYNDPSFTSNLDPFFGFDTGNYFMLDLVPKVASFTFTRYDQYFVDAISNVGIYVMSNRSVTLQQALANGIEEMRSRVSVPVR